MTGGAAFCGDCQPLLSIITSLYEPRFTERDRSRRPDHFRSQLRLSFLRLCPCCAAVSSGSPPPHHATPPPPRRRSGTPFKSCLSAAAPSRLRRRRLNSFIFMPLFLPAFLLRYTSLHAEKCGEAGGRRTNSFSLPATMPSLAQPGPAWPGATRGSWVQIEKLPEMTYLNGCFENTEFFGLRRSNNVELPGPCSRLLPFLISCWGGAVPSAALR